MRKPRVFIDSSVMIAALLSPRGGSYYILTQSDRHISFQINEYVFEELRRVLETKFMDRQNVSSALFLLLGLAGVSTEQNPRRREVHRAERLISANDAPILASALAGSDYLVTLDNEFFNPNVVAAAKEKGLTILKPGDLIRLLNI